MLIQPKADMIILGEAMYTATDKNGTYAPGGVAIADGKIIAVGTKEVLLAYADEDTDIRFYGADKLIIPGFFDSHMHLEDSIYAEIGPLIRNIESEEKCIENIKAWFQNNPNSKWIVGIGWQYSHWPIKMPPNKVALSAAFPHIPVCLVDVDFHAAWVNQKALDIAGINAQTKDPEGGKIYKGEDGEPTGYLEEVALFQIFDLARAYLEGDANWRKDSMKKAIANLNQRGITSIMNAMEINDAWMETLEALAEEESLNLRVNLTNRLNISPDFLIIADQLKEKYAEKNIPIKYWGVKVIVDGVGGIRTAWMTDAYADAPGVYGYPLQDVDILRGRMLESFKAGYGVHCHACGTRAVEFCLDIIEEAKKAGLLREDIRNTITHNDLVNDADFKRFGELNVIASMQPDMLCPTYSYKDNLYPSRFGARLANGWANRRMFDNAKYVSFSSDSPVTPPNPMYGIYRATQRIHDDGTPVGGIYPQEKVSISESLWAYTYAGAYQLNKEEALGSLEVGKIADIVVLDKNIFTAKPQKYRLIESELTLINGQIVFQK